MGTCSEFASVLASLFASLCAYVWLFCVCVLCFLGLLLCVDGVCVVVLVCFVV